MLIVGLNLQDNAYKQAPMEMRRLEVITVSNVTSVQVCNLVIKVRVNWITKRGVCNPPVHIVASALGGLQTTRFIIQFKSTLIRRLSNLSMRVIANASPLC